MQAKATPGTKGKMLRLLLAMALALAGAIGLSHVKAHAEEATLWVSDEYLDFRQYDSNTDNSWRDNIMYIDGEVVMCTDITALVVDGASYWSEGMDPDMAMRILPSNSLEILAIRAVTRA